MNTGNNYSVSASAFGLLDTTKKVQAVLWGAFLIYAWSVVITLFQRADFGECSVLDGAFNWTMKQQYRDMVGIMLVGFAAGIMTIVVYVVGGLLSLVFSISEMSAIHAASKQVGAFYKASLLLRVDVALKMLLLAMGPDFWSEYSRWMHLVWFASIFQMIANILIVLHVREVCKEAETPFDGRLGCVAVAIHAMACLMTLIAQWVVLPLTLVFAVAILMAIYYGRAREAMNAAKNALRAKEREAKEQALAEVAEKRGE